MAIRIIASLLLLSCGAAALDDESVLLQVGVDSAPSYNWQEDPHTKAIVDKVQKVVSGQHYDMDKIVAAIPKGFEVAQQLAQGLGLKIDMSQIGQMSAMAAPLAIGMVKGADGKPDLNKIIGIVKPVAEMAQAMGPEKIAETVASMAGAKLDPGSRKALASLKNINVMKYMGFANQAMAQLPKALPMVSKAIEGAQSSGKEQKRRMMVAVGEGRSSAQMTMLAEQSMDAALVSGNQVFSVMFRAARMIMPHLQAAGIISKQDRSILKDMNKVHEEVMSGISTMRTKVSDLHSYGSDAASYQKRAKLVHETTAFAKMNAQMLKKRSHVMFWKLQELIEQMEFVVPEEQLKSLLLEKPVRQLLDDYSPNGGPEAKQSLTSWFNEEIQSQSEMFAGAVDNFLGSVIASMDYKQEVGPMM